VPEGVEYVTGVILGPEDLLVQDVAGRTWRFRLAWIPTARNGTELT
jgi:hypothetical protein